MKTKLNGVLQLILYHLYPLLLLDWKDVTSISCLQPLSTETDGRESAITFNDISFYLFIFISSNNHCVIVFLSLFSTAIDNHWCESSWVLLITETTFTEVCLLTFYQSLYLTITFCELTLTFNHCNWKALFFFFAPQPFHCTFLFLTIMFYLHN